MEPHQLNFIKSVNHTAGDFYPCVQCGRVATDLHHIQCRSTGGTDDVENLKPLCRSCHNQAHGIFDERKKCESDDMSI